MTAALAPAEFGIRPAIEADAPLIYSSAAKSLRSSPFYRDLEPDHYTRIMNELVDTFLMSPKWRVSVAIPEGFPGEIAGYVTHSASERRGRLPVIGFLFVKEDYRGRGVGRMLLEHVVGTSRDFLAILAQPSVLKALREHGYRPQLSPYLL